jgi:flagellar protein FliS
MSQETTANDNMARRVASASPEELVAMLLTAGQRFLAQAVQAMGRKDHLAKGEALGRVSAIIDELNARLNHREGGELVTSLITVYALWMREIASADAHQQPERLLRVSAWMGELKDAWEQVVGSGKTSQPAQAALVTG